MKTLQKLCKSFFLFIFVLCGCSEEGVRTEGYILKVEDNRILVAENITLDIEYRALYPEKVTAVAIRFYDYYNPDIEAICLPVELEITE